jgi:hypothetical protein
MTIEEIQTALAAMVVALTEKRMRKPNAELKLVANERPCVLLRGEVEYGFPGSHDMEFIRGDTVEDAVEKAFDYIDAIPDHKTVVMQTYLGKLADAVDYGHENNIPAEYVDPVRITQKAMSDNLIAAPKVLP